jgi:RNA-directed DNA polymerase
VARKRAVYTRYADDLAFSGDRVFEKAYRRFHVAVCRLALEEGFEINTRKTRLMRQGVRQRLAGLVVNVRPNISRWDYDRLKAILYNCARHGPSSQTKVDLEKFRQSLAGKIQYMRMIHPERGQKLQQLFERITWAQSPNQVDG